MDGDGDVDVLRVKTSLYWRKPSASPHPHTFLSLAPHTHPHIVRRPLGMTKLGGTRTRVAAGQRTLSTTIILKTMTIKISMAQFQSSESTWIAMGMSMFCNFNQPTPTSISEAACTHTHADTGLVVLKATPRCGSSTQMGPASPGEFTQLAAV